MPPRYLIVNADDFGMSSLVNAGVIEAHERGVVTAATLMVRMPAAAEAAAYARRRPQLTVGLHLDLGEWSYADGEWRALYDVVDWSDERALAAEVCNQLDAFADMVGRRPTHLDSHQHVHRVEPVRGLLRRAGRELGVPVRHQHPGIAYRGDFYGQDGKGIPYPAAITLDALIAVLDTLPSGWTELGCHPGHADPELATSYRDERPVELAVLCDPLLRAAIADRGIELASFGDLASRRRCADDC